MRKLLIGSCALALAGSAYGQSFNVDFNIQSGAGNGVPANAYKGAAGQTGHWNAVSSASSTPLTNLNNAATPVTLTRTGSGTIVNVSTGALGGDDEKLMEDAFRGNIGGTITLSFNNLEAGHYALYTYAINPASSVVSIVNVANSTSRTDQQIGSMLGGPGFFVGATHGLHVAQVTNGTLTLTIEPAALDMQAYIGGLQLVKLNGPRLRLHVDDGAAAGGTGAAWADAMTHPQTALSTARFAGGANTEIWVANGFYEPTSTTERFVSFDIPNKLHFLGGFAGNETSKDQRGANLCYLNGNIGGSGASDNSYTVVDASLTDSETLIDGFRIHNGRNDDGGPSDADKGGGLRLQGSSAVIRNCNFVDNYAGNSGGAVYSDAGSPTFVNCLFYQNEAFEGSAIHHSGDGILRMYNCEFVDNYGFEGTVQVEEGDALLVGGYFHGNYVGGEGGAVKGSTSTTFITLVNCTIGNNAAGQDCGGVYVESSADAVIRNSILWANESAFGGEVVDQQMRASGAGSNITVTTSTVQGMAGAAGQDPLFVDADGNNGIHGDFDDNYHLQANSPAINSGSNAVIPADVADLDEDGNTVEVIPFDFDDNSRIRMGVVDRGAFERLAGAGLGDMNCDGVVSVGDIGPFVTALTNPAGYAASFPNCDINNGDLDGNGVVSVGDIGGLVEELTN